MTVNYPQVVVTPNLKLNLISMNDILAENLITIDNFAGSSSGSSVSIGEIPIGAINSVNTTYTLAHTPLPGIGVYLNGSRLALTTDYTVSGAVLTMLLAPPTGSAMQVDYRY